MMRPLQRTESAASDSEQSELVSCSLFEKFTAGLGEEKKRGFLDLGPAQSGVVDFFSRFPCRLTLWDISDEIQQFGKLTDDNIDVTSRIEALLSFDPGDGYDLILCWDLLNYLDEAYLSQFAQHLARCLRPGGAVHGFMSASHTVPLTPAHYTLLDGGHMQRQFSHLTRSTGRVYYQQQLQRVLSPLIVAKAVLLRNGTQEYLFTRR